jgi:SAM-dependent methyltransferase
MSLIHGIKRVVSMIRALLLLYNSKTNISEHPQMTFPELYHAHHSSDQEDISFWVDLAESRAGAVLELGCGTGRVMAQLARRGYRVFGLDHQREMLSVLQKTWPGGQGSSPSVFQADMSAFQLASHFPLILLPCNTLSTLSPSHRSRTLKNAAKHLPQDGWLAASIPNPTVLAQLPEIGESEVEDYFPHPVDGEPVQVSSSWERKAGKFILRWHYDHLIPDGTVERLTVETSHEILLIQSYIQEIQAAGFEILAMYGDFARSAYNSRSPYFIFIAGLATTNKCLAQPA